MSLNTRTPGKPIIVIVTTVPETLSIILSGQPKRLNETFEVHLVTSNAEACEILCHQESVPVHHVEMARRISPLRDVRSVVRMYRLLRRLRPDVVHSYTPKAGLVAMLAAALCRIPVRVHTFTGLIFPTAKGVMKTILVCSDRFVCRLATRIVPESIGVKNDLHSSRITSKPLELIGNGNIAGIDIEYFSRKALGVSEVSQSIALELDITDDSFVFVFIGRLNRDKGVQELAIAFQNLSEALFQEDLRLVLIGPLDTTAPISLSTQSILNEHPKIHCFGFQSDVRPFLYLADVICLPSYREGFPNVLLQAGAMSVAAITTNISGCNEIITPKVNGWIVSPKDVVQLVQAMNEALQQRDKLPDMGFAARQRVVKNFERTAYIAKLVRFYHQEVEQAYRSKRRQSGAV